MLRSSTIEISFNTSGIYSLGILKEKIAKNKG
jgi:hypothetical protein